jgi:hypothetical protein
MRRSDAPAGMAASNILFSVTGGMDNIHRYPLLPDMAGLPVRQVIYLFPEHGHPVVTEFGVFFKYIG